VRIRRESGAYVTQMLRAKFAYDGRHEYLLRDRSAQQGMFLFDPSVHVHIKPVHLCDTLSKHMSFLLYVRATEQGWIQYGLSMLHPECQQDASPQMWRDLKKSGFQVSDASEQCDI
jgi:hypothetical protein